jgi:hypothetical protein
MERVETRMEGVETRMEAFENRVMIRFEEVERIGRLSFEAVEALRETTDRGFADVRTDHQEQVTLLHTAVKHVRRRVERVERPAREEEGAS